MNQPDGFVNMNKEMIWQYFVALICCFGILLLLCSSSIGRRSLSLPENNNIDHPWHGGDIMTYVEPAKAFLDTGMFLRNGQPDMHRTVGYPFFLSVTMQLFGKYWIVSAYIIQLAVFALLFPSCSYIATSLFPDMQRKEVRLIFFLLMVNGVCMAYVGLLLTDQFFTSLLTAGLACGFAAIRNESWRMTVLHVLLVGYAAQVRPTLGLFFLADYFLLIYLSFIFHFQFTIKRYYSDYINNYFGSCR